MTEDGRRFRLSGSRTSNVRRNVPLSRNELARQLMTLAAQLPNLPKPGEWRILALDPQNTDSGSVMMRMRIARDQGNAGIRRTMEVTDPEGEPEGVIGNETEQVTHPTGRQRGLELCRIFARLAKRNQGV